MADKMFCFQCQEACHNTGCTLGGMCGKKAETANLMDEIFRQLKLIALTRNADRELGRFITKSLFMTITNVNFDDSALRMQLDAAAKLVGANPPELPVGVRSCENEDIRSLRELLTYGVKGLPLMRNMLLCWGKKMMLFMDSFSKHCRLLQRKKIPENFWRRFWKPEKLQ